MASASSISKDSSHLIPIIKLNLDCFIDKWFSIHNNNEQTLSNLCSTRQTHPIEVFSCLVYLVECHPYERIRVWLRENEAQIDKCSDYMSDKCDPNRMKPCWVCKWVDWDTDWMIDVEPLDETSIIKPDFYRLIGDRNVGYGDGGQTFLVYPVWIHEHLPVSETRRGRLLGVLHALNEQRQDFHAAPSPVEDIIDPDLLAYRPRSFDRAKWIERCRRQLEPFEREARYFKRDLANGEYAELSEHEQLRDTYQWLPSEFVIQTDGKVDIRSPIHHLPVTPEYRRTYGDIAQIFHAMLPMFEQMKLIDRSANKEQRLQVIVKAQSYNIKAGKKGF
jgi:hypothetical protein